MSHKPVVKVSNAASKVKHSVSTKKTSSNGMRSGNSNWFKNQARGEKDSQGYELRESRQVSNRILPKINQLLITEDHKAITVDVIRVQLIEGVMHGRAICPESGKYRPCYTAIGNTWAWK